MTQTVPEFVVRAVDRYKHLSRLRHHPSVMVEHWLIMDERLSSRLLLIITDTKRSLEANMILQMLLVVADRMQESIAVLRMIEACPLGSGESLHLVATHCRGNNSRRSLS